MVRKRSVVWGFFKTVDSEHSESVECLLCGASMVRQGHGTTANMLRHLRVKHPAEVDMKTGEGGTASINGHEDMDTEHFCSVDVALEDGDSDSLTTVNEACINSAINGILEAVSQGAPAAQTAHEEASDDRPLTRARNKRSLIWRYFEHLDSLAAARCRICTKKLQCFEGTSNLHRHMSKRHPEVFSQLDADRQNRRTPHSSQISNADVEMALEDGDSDTTENEAGVNSAVSREAPAEQATHEEASDDRPVTRARNKRSLIWRHYEHLESLAAARCRICMKKLQCDGGSTSNLHRHMSKRHPEVFCQLGADRQHPAPSHSSQHSSANGDTPSVGATETQRQFSVSRASAREKRVLKRERELIEALRRAQREEARALEHQRELLEKLRAVNVREAAAERQHIESLRKAQLEEAQDLSRQREELQKEKTELQKKWEELQQEREELVLFSRGAQAT